MPTTADNTLRERLKAIREQIAEQRSKRADLRKERDSAKETFSNASHDGPVTEWPEFAAAQDAVKNVGEVDDRIAQLEADRDGILQLIGPSSDGDSGGHNGSREAAAAAIAAAAAGQGMWSGHALLGREDGGYQQAREMGLFHSRQQFGTIEMGEIASREEAVRMFSGPFYADLPTATGAPVDSTGMAVAIPQDRRGMAAPLLRRLSFLDLIPKGTTDSNTVEYVQVSAIPGSAAPVAEGQVKPQEGLGLVDATAPVRTIAGWIKVNRQAMDDTAGLATLINTLLPYDVRRQIEAQILTGNGVGQNLRGIYNTTGVIDVPFVSAANPADMILRGITQLILNDADPNVLVANPLTWQDIMLMKASGSGEYLAGGPFAYQAPTVWGLALTTSRAVAQATPLMGDSMGATLLFREGVNVKTSDSDQDDFVRNRVTVLAECRVGFPVWRPASWAVIHTS